MLSHKPITRADAGETVAYYNDGLDDYYASVGAASAWLGKGAAALKLKGAVARERFRQLLEGEIAPGVTVRGTTRRDSSGRLGMDFTFAAPKSVSMEALIGGNEAIIRVHDQAVAKAIAAAEALAQARLKAKGKSRIEDTGNLVVATFRHETSREQDPQLHTHAVIMNLTQRRDGEWRALLNDKLFAATRTHFLDAVYLAELAKGLAGLGYSLRHERDGRFELAHIGREQIAEFSKRREQVDGWLAERGLRRETATAAERQQAAYQTRAKKVSVEREALFKAWSERAAELGVALARAERSVQTREALQEQNRGLVKETAAAKARGAVEFAIKHLSEREAVMEHGALVTAALQHATGHALLADIEREIGARVRRGSLVRDDDCFRSADTRRGQALLPRQAWVDLIVEAGFDRAQARERVDTAIEEGRLVRAEPRYTTQAALEHERQVLTFEREGRGRHEPVLPAERVAERLAAEKLTEGQRAAVALILSTGDRIVGVQGFAGTGKSTMLATAKQVLEEQGYTMHSLASYRTQVVPLRELKIGGRTLAGFVEAKEKGIHGKTLLVIDEASVVPSRLMRRTLKLAEKANTRVVLIGDTEQTPAIEAGRPFHQLQMQGMATARMRDIQRQKTPELKAAVELAAEGKAAEALTWLPPVAIAEDGARRERLAQDYARLSAGERDGTLIVAGTNEARRALNTAVRAELGLAGKGHEFDTLNRRDTTQAERRHAKYYRIGDAIQPEKDTKDGLKRGELYAIRDMGPGNVLTVEAEDGQRLAFTPRGARNISVYERRRLEFAEGDVVRVTRNEGLPDFATGTRLRVAEIAPGAVTLMDLDGEQRLVLPADKPLHLDHAYAMTAHSSQSVTVDRVLAEMLAKSRTTARDTFYVAISRARLHTRIYTDDARRLPEAVAQKHEKSAALDLARKGRADGYRRQQSEAGRGREEAMIAETGRQAQQAAMVGHAPQKGAAKEKTGGRDKGHDRAGGHDHGGRG